MSGSEEIPCGPDGRPELWVIRSPRDAELLAAAWLRFFGFADAAVTGAGSDGGIDVRAAGAVAQVKAHMRPVGRPDLQRLSGVAASNSVRPIFFSLTAYTAQARAWADEVGMALFRFDHTGVPDPVNESATGLVAAGSARNGAPGQDPQVDP